MGRAPIGKTAMTGAERTRRYRLKFAADKPVTKPAAKPDAALERELAAARAELAAVKSELALLKQERETFRHDGPVTKQPTQYEGEIAALRAELDLWRRQRASADSLMAAATDYLDNKGRIIPHDMYELIHNAVHPDRVTNPKMKARYDAAFKFMTEHQNALAKRKPPPVPPPLPRTRAELEAAKWHAREARKAKRKAAKASKAPRKALT